MNATQIKAARNLWSDVTEEAHTMTAIEMALTNHNLNRNGEIAILRNGSKYAWCPILERWICYR